MEITELVKNIGRLAAEIGTFRYQTTLMEIELLELYEILKTEHENRGTIITEAALGLVEPLINELRKEMSEEALYN
ncbi:MAG TPA: hypothetical protein PKA10_14005 [Selenomonadales bacterium]|nr:hypothetical protein [Selenomonadales bacterium]